MMTQRISTRLWLMAGLSFVLFFTAVGAALYGMKSAENALKTVYEDRAVPLGQLAGLRDIVRENRTDIFRALQHDPKVPTSGLHDHPIGKHWEAIEQRWAEGDVLWKAYMATYLTDEEKVLAASVEQTRIAWVARLKETIAALKAGDFGMPVLAAFLKAGSTEGEAAITALNKLMEYQLQVAKSEYEAATTRYRHNQIFFALLAVFGMAGQLGMAFFTIRRIDGGLQAAGEAAQAIAAGDLTRPLPPPGQDEIGTLMGHVSAMRDNLSDLVGALRRNVEALNRSAGELTQSAATSRQAGEVQSEAAASMAAAVEEMSVSIDQVGEHAREAHSVTAASDSQAREGSDIIHDAASEMDHIATSINALATTIHELDALSGQISSIVSAIREVADQTNLLALNAAIEAARAGEQGRGFAVVADEVRKLAERTGGATKEIAGMIGKIQEGTRRAAVEMADGVARVASGVALAGKAGQSVIVIRESAERASRAVDDINLALREQSVAAREIARRVEGVALGAEENSAAVAQTAAEAQRLETLAHELDRLSARFRVA
ncbi:MAG: methyl-accepting chemotaxis protein [Sulfurisoma sp.]|nr:methyl-accepting chemotaxis protein [Sulfurisoma sp.]